MSKAIYVSAATMANMYGFSSELLHDWALRGILPQECWQPSPGGSQFYYNPKECIAILPKIIDKYRETLSAHSLVNELPVFRLETPACTGKNC